MSKRKIILIAGFAVMVLIFVGARINSDRMRTEPAHTKCDLLALKNAVAKTVGRSKIKIIDIKSTTESGLMICKASLDEKQVVYTLELTPSSDAESSKPNGDIRLVKIEYEGKIWSTENGL